MANFGTSAQVHEWHLPVPAQDGFEALVTAAQNIGFNVLESDDFTRTVQFTTPISAMTWGDRGIAQIIKAGDECDLRIQSASRNANTPLAAGKFAKNMQILFTAIVEILKAQRGL